MTLTDDDILARLTAVEHGTVERKTASDSRDWVKAAVALSNTLENDEPGVLFVGVRDKGQIEADDNQNFEKLQKRVSDELSNIYPPIYPLILVRQSEGRKFLAIIIYGSPNRPHFAGKAYRRDGTKTVDASEQHIEQFIARRTSKIAEMLKWKGKNVTLTVLRPEVERLRMGAIVGQYIAVLLDCNEHYITVSFSDGPNPHTTSYPLRRVELSFDNGKQWLALEVLPP